MSAQFFADVKLDTTEQHGSYGIGLQMGQQLLQSQLNVDVAAVAKGIYDAIQQNAPAIELQQVSEALQQMQQQAAELQQAQFQEIEQAGKDFLAENKKAAGVKETESGLQYEVLVEGNGAVPSRQDKVRVHYTGSLIDGTVFDSSVQRGQPAEFPVSGVISGWVEALSMMPVGSKWRLTIPHNLAYGERGAGASIPPFSTLIFEVELLDIL
ncbi:FKBP-type peptidyl-prolyl cis-trans isomerase FklB [Pasteurella testudinis DSM 23072]|uniref:Peptidyl-prolyl cis-trans isomerase n=1 Tax=Pasteurella testudinis DSM 23072 TaxID=1122938 RepID=A0A1W1USC3_9PAST|nr:FKBP-type peptidyl-prolyl cis-trans isomerase [Pasteurella testudinis]SMB83930.1 FKBP-type peptidyl-prolyl cis-trans isomerase FklB [Pasteurella testudinis DSM 23072]SUB50944.1 peptidyl-prolyl cis-trans isomerase [Pasteurella testudinis]